MIKAIALCAISLTLSSCATFSDPKPPAPRAIDPRLCVQAKDEPPVRGSIVRPIGDERAQVAEFLDGEARARDWGRQGWAIADVARKLCD